MALIWQLAWRFRSGKRQNGFISFISASSTLGIGLGCFVLILLLSVMNGFEQQLKDKLLQVIPHGELYAVGVGGMQNWQLAADELANYSGVNSVEPYVKATGMLQKGKNMKAVEVTGLSHAYSKNRGIQTALNQKAQLQLENSANGIVVGEKALAKLNAKVGDSLQLLLPQPSDSGQVRAPKSVSVKVVASISIGGELDSHIALMSLADLAEVLDVPSGAQGLRFYFDDPFAAPELIRTLGSQFSQPLYVSSWMRTQGHLYQDIQLVRVVVYLALILVIAVACFNIVSTLVMAVNEKQAEIAMLKTMGATDRQVILIFVSQGLINGLIGISIGVALGIMVSIYLTSIASSIEHLIGVKFLSGDIYFIDFLPSQLQWTDVYASVAIALLLTILATYYPAKKAAGIEPAKALG